MNKKTLLILFLFYTIAHGGILFIPQAVYWDDWTLFNISDQTIFNAFKLAGSMFNLTGYLHVYLLKVGIWFYKYLTFILMFASGVLLYYILEENKLVPKELEFLTVLLFLILPFNPARVAIIDFPYTLYYFIFFFAWHLINKKPLLSLILFFFSFNINSLLVFYILPILGLAYKSQAWKSKFQFVSFLKQKWPFLVVPFLYFFIKTHYFPPSGPYSHYNNQYDIHYLFPTIQAQFEDLVYFLLKPQSYLIMTFLVCGIFSVLKLTVLTVKFKFSPNQKYFLYSLGLLCILSAGFPYWILGHIPTFIEWTTRHQLLFPLGSALIIAVFLYSLQPLTRFSCLVIIVGFCLNFWTCKYISFFIDWNKQRSLIELLSSNPTIQKSDLIIFNDNTSNLNALNRTYRFYEWNGIMKLAFGNETRFGINSNDYTNYKQGEFDQYFDDLYVASSHRRHPSMNIVIVEINSLERKNLKEIFYPNIVLSARIM